MPFYRYKCDNCGYSFKVFESLNGNRDRVRVCERCGTASARRTLARVGIVYKGSGFHSTDYRRDRKKEQEEKSSEEA